MITDAKNLPITGAGYLPNVSGALDGYFQPMSFSKIVKSVSNFENKEVQTTYTFRGVKQPLAPKKLEMKPEGQRAWEWQQIHAEPGLALDVDEVITLDGDEFRVMARLDYRLYGYIEYHVVKGYS